MVVKNSTVPGNLRSDGLSACRRASGCTKEWLGCSRDDKNDCDRTRKQTLSDQREKPSALSGTGYQRYRRRHSKRSPGLRRGPCVPCRNNEARKHREDHLTSEPLSGMSHRRLQRQITNMRRWCAPRRSLCVIHDHSGLSRRRCLAACRNAKEGTRNRRRRVGTRSYILSPSVKTGGLTKPV